MDPSLEIRKLSPRSVRELAQILETNGQWKKLMCIIPKRLEKDNFVCNITLQNQQKLIENASKKDGRACTEILLHEWSTSGRVRPALGHLLHLLKKGKLWRAADYIAVNLLHQERLQRLEETVTFLESSSYLDSDMSFIRPNSDEVARHDHVSTVIPQIAINTDIEKNDRVTEFTVPLAIKKQTSQELAENSVSDRIKFSTNSISTGQNLSQTEDVRPKISQLLNEVSEANLSNVNMKKGLITVRNTDNLEAVLNTNDCTEEVQAFNT